MVELRFIGLLCARRWEKLFIFSVFTTVSGKAVFPSVLQMRKLKHNLVTCLRAQS